MAPKNRIPNAGSSENGNGAVPAGFWQWALKTAPTPARFLLAGYLLLAVASSILAARVSLRALLITAVLVLLSAVAVGALANAARKQRSYAGSFLTWCLIVLLVLILLLFTSSAFFGLPEKGAVLVAKLLDAPELVFARGSSSQVLTSSFWPAETTDPLDVSGTRIDRLNALAKRPSVTVTPEHPLGGGTVYLNVLTIQGEGILTKGLPLHVEAIKILSAQGVIRSSATPPAKAAQGPGQSAGDVTLVIQDRIVGALSVDLSGQSGADGADGKPGARGAPGNPGEDAASYLAGCAHGAGAGGRGQTGVHGDPGQPGQSGGSGGILRLEGEHPEALARVVTANISGGSGGAGGAGGAGGPGGPGGPGGHDRKPWCQGDGAQGPDGNAGERGSPGAPGAAGKNGAIRLIHVDTNGEPST